MDPTCEKCQHTTFVTRFLEDASTLMVFCEGCGHIVGVMPDYHILARTLVELLTRGSRDGGGHPVMRVKNEDQVFG